MMGLCSPSWASSICVFTTTSPYARWVPVSQAFEAMKYTTRPIRASTSTRTKEIQAIPCSWPCASGCRAVPLMRSEEHTSELQSRENLVCRLLLEKKKHTSPYHLE